MNFFCHHEPDRPVALMGSGFFYFNDYAKEIPSRPRRYGDCDPGQLRDRTSVSDSATTGISNFRHHPFKKLIWRIYSHRTVFVHTLACT